MNKDIKLKFEDPVKELEAFKKYIKKHDCPKINLDLSALNIFDAMRFIVVSSAYHYQKYPAGKLKYKVASEDTKNLVINFKTTNFELI